MTVIGFDSFDEMLEHMGKAEDAANARTTPRQKAIGWGDYWMQPYQDILVFGRIWTREETEKSEGRYIDQDDPEEVAGFAETMANLDSRYERGYRFGTAWSEAEREGELGDTHISVMIPITQEEFEEAKAVNWNALKIINMPWFPTSPGRVFAGLHGEERARIMRAWGV